MTANSNRKILRTKLCDMLGIEYPIIAAGMGTASGPTLAAAVSNAGGLGVLAGIDLSPEELRKWIKKTKTLTDKPFAVDTIFIKALPEVNSLDEVRAQLPADAVGFAGKVREEIDVPDVKGRPDTYVSSRQDIMEQFKVCVEEGVPILVSALGNPGWLMDEIRAQGMKIMSLIGNVRGACRVAQIGVDIVIAQGYEAGGHTGDIGGLALIPQVVDAVSPIPVVAAGGIADGRGLAAALALGAVGVWCGTVFCTSHEACVDHVEAGIYTQWEIDLRKRKILEARDEDSHITRAITGKTFRNLDNKFVQTWEDKHGPILKQWPFQDVLLSNLREGVRRRKLDDYFPWTPGGQIAGMLTELRSARQIVDDMVAGAVETIGDKLCHEVDLG